MAKVVQVEARVAQDGALVNGVRSASPQQMVSIAASRFGQFEVQFSSPESGSILPVNG